MYDTQDSGFTLFGRRIQANSAPPLPLNSQAFLDDQTERSDSEQAKNVKIPCPRCNSVKTKFCYFNNYNLNQPRHFCKSCQRYWTAGGMMRNVPVGAGRRKNKHLPSHYRHITISPENAPTPLSNGEDPASGVSSITSSSVPRSDLPSEVTHCYPSPMLGFYAYWAVPLRGSEDCLSPLSTMTNSCRSGEGLTTLGKRGRDVRLIDEEKSDKCRVGDSDEASKRQSCEEQRTKCFRLS